jgi:hypothetical protein
VSLYWDIGRLIVEKQSSGEHGDAVVEQLTADLQDEFPDLRGFSLRRTPDIGMIETATILYSTPAPTRTPDIGLAKSEHQLALEVLPGWALYTFLSTPAGLPRR